MDKEGEITLSTYTDCWEDGKQYYIIIPQYKKFEDIDEAVEYFKNIAFSEDNLGIKQSLWNSLNPGKDPDDMDKIIMEKEVRAIKISDYV